jgi:tight adherence protein B
VLATAAAHPGCAAALDRLAAVVVGRGIGLETVTAGPVQPEDAQAQVLARLADGWQLSARHGVQWAALIDTVAADLADRQRAEAVRNAQVAGPRVSGYVLAVMPALGILLGAGMGADPVHVLLGTAAGSVLLLVGSTLTCLGLAWTAAIVRS